MNYNFNLFNDLLTKFNIYILNPTKNQRKSIRFIIILKKDSSISHLRLKRIKNTN